MAGIYFLPCSPTLIEWLKKKLGTCYIFVERADLSENDAITPLICYAAVADKTAVAHRDWKEFVKARKKMLPALTWLILLGDVKYELEGKDDKFIRVEAPKDLATVLVKLCMEREAEEDIDNDDET